LRILVCGGRDFSNYDLLCDVLKKYEVSTIITGGARGADTLAFCWGYDHNKKVLTYPANWKKHGKAAGFIRNQQMLDEGHPDLVIAFPGGRGTADMVRRSKEAGIPTRVIKG